MIFGRAGCPILMAVSPNTLACYINDLFHTGKRRCHCYGGGVLIRWNSVLDLLMDGKEEDWYA